MPNSLLKVLKGFKGSILLHSFINDALEIADKQIDINSVDLNKLKVRDLKKILNDWDEVCDGCLEKADFIKRIEQLKPKYSRGGEL